MSCSYADICDSCLHARDGCLCHPVASVTLQARRVAMQSARQPAQQPASVTLSDCREETSSIVSFVDRGKQRGKHGEADWQRSRSGLLQCRVSACRGQSPGNPRQEGQRKGPALPVRAPRVLECRDVQSASQPASQAGLSLGRVVSCCI
jgi:hypothetical protein